MSESAALTPLKHALDYTYGQAQLARTREEHENFDITLRLLGLLLDGWTAPDMFSLACSYAVGVSHKKYLRRKAERAEFERRELLAAIPDYDYSLEPRIPDRDPMDGKRHFGNQYASHGMNTEAIKEAAARLGMTKRTIYRRLSAGWTWERAISETRQSPGRILYGNQFCDLAIEGIKGDDPNSISGAHENDATTSFRSGGGTTADSRHIASRFERASGQPVLSLADRRGAPKRLSSPAQARLEARFRAANLRAANREVYFGA